MQSSEVKENQWLGVDRLRAERRPYWGQRRPHLSPVEYPRRDRVVLHWSVHRRHLPMSEGVGLATLYGLWKTSEDVGSSSHGVKHPYARALGTMHVHVSDDYVATRRLKKGDRVGVSWKNHDDHDAWTMLVHRMKNQDRYLKQGSASTRGRYWSPAVSRNAGDQRQSRLGQLNIPLGRPTQYPSLSDSYDRYNPRGEPSQRTRSLGWSGPSRWSRSPTATGERMARVLTLAVS